MYNILVCLVTLTPSRRKVSKAEKLFFALGNAMNKRNIDCNNALGLALKRLIQISVRLESLRRRILNCNKRM